MSARDVSMMISVPCSAVNERNGGDGSSSDRTSSEIMHVSTLMIIQPIPTSSTLTNPPAPAISALIIHSPTVLAAKHKEEEKRIQMVIENLIIVLKQNVLFQLFHKAIV